MNYIDESLQKEFPTLMVPENEPLPECRMGRTRLLMAKDGLYIDTRQPWGSLTIRLWKSPRELPYGRAEEKDDFEERLREGIKIIENQIIREIEEHAEKGLEWAGIIIWSKDKGMQYYPLSFIATPSDVHYIKPNLPENNYIVIDIHSHHEMNPFFSITDNIDECGRVRISICLGNYNKEKKQFEKAMRYAVEGFFIRIID